MEIEREIELVWLDGSAAKVQLFLLTQPTRFDELFKLLSAEQQTKLAPLQASRFGKKIHASTIVQPGDQIAWLSEVKVDPQAARMARVEKQRKGRRRIRSIPKKTSFCNA
jgi:putative ubiquitin-RnfH superfamily antitoxin RatB of RatAB toxin-antitoxin module